MNADDISAALEEASTVEMARKRRQHATPLRGIRGTSDGDVARVLAKAYKATPAKLPDHEAALDGLFGTAFEDGLVAVGLLAAAALDAPHDALDLATEWLDRVDDVATADAIGWLVLGPAGLTAGRLDEVLEHTRRHAHPDARRAGMAAALALTPAMVEGPAAAALRERLGERAIRFVEAPANDALAAFATGFVRDEAPTVRKALRRVVRAWTDADAAAVAAWGASVKGGLPKMIGEEVDRARRRARPPA